MNKKPERRPDPAPIQVFEVTMDNPEDQDELNRRLQKPADSKHIASKTTRKKQDEPTTEMKSSSRDNGSS
jgi:hypothetical protein